MSNLLDDIGPWEQRTFPHATFGSELAHLKREVVELESEVDHLENFVAIPATAELDRIAAEAADIIMIAASVIYRCGRFPSVVLAKKFKTVQGRTYGPPDSEGVSEHVRN